MKSSRLPPEITGDIKSSRLPYNLIGDIVMESSHLKLPFKTTIAEGTKDL